jgi:cytoskeleton protein RodZ
MESVGSELRTAREKRNVPLRQIAEVTRISHSNLERLEAGNYKDLPGGVYNRAFIRAYCEFLGLDARAILERYEQEITPPSEKTSRAKERPTTFDEPLFKPHPLVTWGVVLLISIVGLYLSRHWIASVFSPYFAHSPASKIAAPADTKPQPPPTSAKIPAPQAPPSPLPGTSDVTSPTAQVAVPPPKTSPEDLPPQTGPPRKIRLELSAVDKCWISVNSDGNRSMVRIVEPGEKHIFDADDRIFLIIGNAGGIRLRINGKAARTLGKPAEVVRILVNEQSIKDLLEKSPG